MSQVSIILTERERDVILAALRHWTISHPLDDALVREIATNAGKHEPLSHDEIDALSDRINTLDK